MGHTVKQGVDLCAEGRHPGLICRMPSGWVVLANMQYLRGYCILLADPVASSLNELDRTKRSEFLVDMARVGEVLQQTTGAVRINYAIMGNSDPTLHAHIVPRYSNEPEEYLHNLPWSYPEEVMNSCGLDPIRDRELMDKIKEALSHAS